MKILKDVYKTLKQYGVLGFRYLPIYIITFKLFVQ